MLNTLITVTLFLAAVGGCVTIFFIYRVMRDFPETRKRMYPLQVGLALSIPFFLLGSLGRLSGLYVGPTLWASAWGSMLWLYWFAFCLPIVAWVHGDLKYKREKLKNERAEKINNGAKAQIKQGAVQ